MVGVAETPSCPLVHNQTSVAVLLKGRSFIFSFGSLTFIRRWSVTPLALSGRMIFITGNKNSFTLITTVKRSC